jgi:SsrA-binding protein
MPGERGVRYMSLMQRYSGKDETRRQGDRKRNLTEKCKLQNGKVGATSWLRINDLLIFIIHNSKRGMIKNRKARHEYFIVETYEAGIVLKGDEVKSIRNGRANLADSYCKIVDGEVFLVGMHISPYEKSRQNLNPYRERKLLLNKNEIKRFYVKLEERGFTLIPLSLYFNNRGIAKVELGLCKGKRKHEKREAIRIREMEREARRKVKSE